MYKKSFVPNCFTNVNVETVRFNQNNHSVDSLCNELAVCVQDVILSYGIGTKKIYALNGVSAKVPNGVIYSLLGPSGCGKTSILRCILGCISPSTGSIQVFGSKPNEPGSNIPGAGVGYMPQDIALHDDLTIEEMLIYFGKIFSMKWSELNKKVDYFTTILRLPEKGRLIGQLSGGQKRRTSFACALMHDPDLLILDEPTVGVDPVVREKIWDILVQYTEKMKRTVIITTHYIEETKRSHLVGFMRNGQMLVEDKPSELITRYEATTLEDAFYKVCYEQKKVKKVENQVKKRQISKERSKQNLINSSNKKKIASQSIRHTIKDWYSKLITIYWKIMLQSSRQPAALTIQFLLPVISFILYSFCIATFPMKVSVAVFNEENPPFLSEIYIKSINNEVIDIQHFDNLSLAIDSVKKAKAWGVLHIKPNFSETLIEGFENIDEWDGDEAPDDRMKLYSDLSCIFKTITATKMLDEAFVNFSANALTKLNYNPSIFNIPIQMGEAIHGTLQGGNFFGLKTFYIPGVLIIISYTISFAMTILAVIAEKTEKILDRNYAAGVSPTHLILGHLLTRLTFMSINLIVVFFVAIYGFHIPTNGSRTLALALLILQCIAGLTNGLVISALLPNLHYAAILSNGILLFMFIASGVLWSVGSMPYWFRWLSYFMPTTIPTESFRHILSRGLPFSHFEVYSGFLVTIFYIFVFFLSSIFFFRH